MLRICLYSIEFIYVGVEHQPGARKIKHLRQNACSRSKHTVTWFDFNISLDVFHSVCSRFRPKVTKVLSVTTMGLTQEAQPASKFSL